MIIHPFLWCVEGVKNRLKLYRFFKIPNAEKTQYPVCVLEAYFTTDVYIANFLENKNFTNTSSEFLEKDVKVILDLFGKLLYFLSHLHSFDNKDFLNFC